MKNGLNGDYRCTGKYQGSRDESTTRRTRIKVGSDERRIPGCHGIKTLCHSVEVKQLLHHNLLHVTQKLIVSLSPTSTWGCVTLDQWELRIEQCVLRTHETLNHVENNSRFISTQELENHHSNCTLSKPLSLTRASILLALSEWAFLPDIQM